MEEDNDQRGSSSKIWFNMRHWLRQFPWNTKPIQDRVHELWREFSNNNDFSPGEAFYRYLVWRLEGEGKGN